MKLTEIELRTLQIVQKFDGQWRASAIGWELWKDSGRVAAHPHRGEGSHGTNKFCRAAGKILNRLEKLGLTEWGTDGHGVLWSLTIKGRAALREVA